MPSNVMPLHLKRISTKGECDGNWLQANFQNLLYFTIFYINVKYFLSGSKCYTHIQLLLASKLIKFAPTQPLSHLSDKECMPLLEPEVLKERFRDVVCSYPGESMPMVNFLILDLWFNLVGNLFVLCRVTFTLYIKIKLLKKWTLEMKKSHFPVLVLKYSSFNTVFL